MGFHLKEIRAMSVQEAESFLECLEQKHKASKTYVSLRQKPIKYV